MTTALTPTRPLWLRAVMVREGDDVVTRCCVVTEGQFFPIEVRVNVPKLIAAARALGLGPRGDNVAGFGSFLKKAVKTVTKNKVVKAVGKVASKIVKNPVVQIANPALALGLHNASVFTGGKGIMPKPIGKLVDAGTTSVISTLAPGVGPAALAASQKLGAALRAGQSLPGALGGAASGAIGAGALDFVSPKAAAALGVGLKTVGVAKLSGQIAAVAKNAGAELDLGKKAAAAVVQKKISPKQAAPLIAKAAKVKATLSKTAPALAKQVVQSQKVKTQLGVIAQKARAGSPDARLASAVIARSAKALDEIAAIEARAAGGLAGLLLTADGRIVRSPRGRFLLRSSVTPRPDVLYRGPNAPTLKGAFTAVAGQSGVPSLWSLVSGSGEGPGTRDQGPSSQRPSVAVGASPGWGGETDPADDYEGPLSPVVPAGGGWTLEVAGVWTP